MVGRIEVDGITFQPIKEEYFPFLLKLYRSTREQELDQIPWTELEKSQFVSQQFYAQHTYYQEQFQNASFDIILIHGEEAGRLYLDVRRDEFRIIDIALLPEFRGKGWGSTLLQNIQILAGKEGKGIGIHVEKNNLAMNLYHRLGFEIKEDKGVYQFMMWYP